MNSGLFPTAEGDAVVIEYQKTGRRWHPHSILTTTATWDAVWSRAHASLLVHDSGSGHYMPQNKPVILGGYSRPDPPPARIWAAPCIVLARYRKARSISAMVEAPPIILSDKALLKMGYVRLTEPMGDPFNDAHHVDGHIEWCEICEDWFDDEDNVPCPHLRWSDAACDTIGSGKAIGDMKHIVPKSVDALCSKLGESLTLALREVVARVGKGGSLYIWHRQDALRDAIDEHEEDDDCNAAVCWLFTLGPGKKLAPAGRATLRGLDARLAKPFEPRAESD